MPAYTKHGVLTWHVTSFRGLVEVAHLSNPSPKMEHLSLEMFNQGFILAFRLCNHKRKHASPERSRPPVDRRLPGATWSRWNKSGNSTTLRAYVPRASMSWVMAAAGCTPAGFMVWIRSDLMASTRPGSSSCNLTTSSTTMSIFLWSSFKQESWDLIRHTELGPEV